MLTARSSLHALVASFLLICLASPKAVGQEPGAGEDADQKTIVTSVTSLPKIPRPIHDAMQSRAYGDAVKLIETALGQDDVNAPDYLVYLQGVALTEAKQYDNAIAAFERLAKDYPDSAWVSRSRFGLAHVYVLQRQYINAGEIYGQEAERLLSRDRKDELAKIYLEFADRYFEGVPADDPSKAKKPDYQQALTYYSEAVKLGPTMTLRQRIEFRIVRCQQEMNQNAEAIASYQRFLDQYGDDSPQSGSSAPEETRAEARYRLGSVQLKAGQRAQARKTWQDFLAKWSDQAAPAEAITELLAQAEYRLAHTYGLPAPGSIGDLELAVTMAERFLANHPDHELAPTAELEIAQGYSGHGRHNQAVERLRSLIDNAAYKDSKQIPPARQMLGNEYLMQAQYDMAIAAWREFLDQHPTDPKWPQVQKQIVDTEYAKAAGAREKKQFEEARTLWQTFLNKYPLDPRAASILLQFGQMKLAEAVEIHNQRIEAALEKGESALSVDWNDRCRKLLEEAIVDWRRVVSKYPGSDQASNASLMIGITLEDRLGRLPEVLESFKKVEGRFADQAKLRIARLTSPQLQLVTERKFRSDERPRIRLTSRNLEKVTVKTYQVDMTDYFRKMHLASGIETLDIALIDPDQQFEHAIEDYQRYKSIDGDIELPATDGPGVTAVTVSSEKLEATTMVVVSDLDMVVKSSRNELFLYVQDMLAGKPADGVSVLISNGSKVFAEEITGPDGILQKNFDELKSLQDLRVFAVREGHVASTVNNLNGLDFAVGLSPRGYLYTDRPAYRAGQLVNIKGIVRWVDQDRFTFKPGEKFRLDVYDSRGRQLQTQTVALNDFGTIHSNLMLPKSAPQGNYRVQLHRKSAGEDDATGALSFETQFQVTEYRLEPVQISVELEKQVYYRGDRVKGTIELKYYYGTPLVGESIEYRFGPDGEVISGTTDDQGKVAVEFETQRFSESQPLQLRVDYRERGLTAFQTVYLATRGFAVTASSVRDVFINGESFETLFKVVDPAGEPVETDLKIEVFQQTIAGGRTGEKLVATHQQTTDAEFGEARQTLSLEEGGIYIIRATGVDQFENEVSGENRIRISGKKDSTRLRILADQHTFQVGEQAKINLHWREQPALALVTFEGAKVLGYKLVKLTNGNNPMQLPMQSDFAPNVYVSVAVMQRNQFHTARSEFQVTQRLKVTVRPQNAELQPGEDLKVEIEVTDPQGNPVAAELSVALVESNLLASFEDVQPAIDAFFSNGRRESSVRQSTSCTFQYRPTTRGVSQFLLAEAERRETLRREVRALAEYGGMAAGDELALGYAGMDGLPTTEAAAAEYGFTPMPGPGLAASAAQGGVDFQVDFESLGLQGQLGAAGQPIVRYRTEIRDGRAVQVPYTVVPLQVQRRLGRSGLQQQAPMSSSNTQDFLSTNGNWSVDAPHVFYERLQAAGGERGQQGGPSRQMIGGVQVEMVPELGNAVIIRGSKRDVDQVMQQIDELQRYDSAWIDHDFDGDGDLDRFALGDLSMNGLTATGQFLVVNPSGQQSLKQLAREQGMQLLPSMMRSETAFWDPMIVIDESGKTEITITMPNRSTAWKLRAKGIDGKTLAGQTSTDVITKKDLFGEMKLPLALTVGDKVKVPVEVHNSLDGARGINVTLKATLGNKSTEQQKTLDVQGPGIHDVEFEVAIEQGEEARFELTVVGGEQQSDLSKRTVTVRPFGFPVYETASGTSSQSTVSLVGFDEKLAAEDVSLEILIGPSINRSLLESVMGGYFPILRCGLPTSNPIERSISDVLGGVGLLEMVGRGRNADSPEAEALSRQIQSGITQLISAQNNQGGWAWTGLATSDNSEPYLSSRVMWALSVAKDAGFPVSTDSLNKGKALLQSSLATASQSDIQLQSILLHAMAVSGSGDFAVGNRLYRERNRLGSSGLTHLSLALAEMNHEEMARDLIELIRIPLGSEPLASQDRRPIVPWMRNQVELQAMYLLTLQKVAPNHPDVAKAAEALLSARIGSRWPVEKSNGPAIAALAKWYSGARNGSGKYKLVVTVNDQEIETMTIDAAVDSSRRVRVPKEILRTDKPQRIEFELDGRASFSYSAVLTGSVPADKVVSTTDTWTVGRRFEPSARMMDGRPVSRGFQVVDGSYRSFTNPITQLPVGERAEVTLSPRRHRVTGRSGEKYDYLVLTEPIPAGCTVLDGSVSGAYEHYEIQPGQITFFIGDRRYPGDIRYTLVGYTPGNYQAPQSIVRSFYEPSQFAVAKVKQLEILPSGSETVDEYRLTPDELYYIGQKEFEKGNHQAAHTHLTELYENWLLDADKHKNVVQWLFASSLAQDKHGDTVKYFEELKEKFPDVEVSFEDILRVAMSYRELAEYERSYLVYRATVEGSFERESQVAGFLNARNEFVRSVQAMERLLRDYPAESYIATATYALAQETYRRAPDAGQDEKLKAAGLTRVHLIDGAIQMLDHFVTTWPEDPADDQASFALATALIDLEQFDAAIERSQQYAERYPDSRLIDSYWYMIGYSHFELEQPQQALTMCRKVAEATFPVRETGGTRSADNRWEAIYIMGQIYHSLGQAANAIAEYSKVKERFADATEAIKFFSRKEISLEEVTTLKPNDPKAVELKFRNIGQAAIKVYRIDLMKFGLMQRNLDRITAINLAGIQPYHEQVVKLGDGKDFRDRNRKLELPLKEEGAYLIVCRGEDLYTSGLALVTPLNLLVQEDATSGRVRVSVKDSTDDSFVSDVHVKVIGSANDDFISGDTDLRGLMIADNVKGTSTVIAAAEDDRYAFFRGDTALQGFRDESANMPAASQPAMPQQAQEKMPSSGKDALRYNLFQQNSVFQEEQQDNYEQLLNNDRSGIMSKEAF